MSINFTSSQKTAIQHSGANLLVAAAAGSGKTAVVAQRAVQLLVEKRVPVNKLLLITFTRAAAAEMRTRVASVLKDRIKNNNDPFLSEQLKALPDADIVTIDSYLTKLLRRAYHVVDIDPTFSVMAEDEKHAISKDAIKKVLDDAFEKSDKDFIFLCDTLGDKNAKKLEDLIKSCYEYARKYNNYIDFIKSWSDEYSLDEADIKQSKWMKECLNDISFGLKTALWTHKLALKYVHLPNGPANYEEKITQEIALIESASQKDDFDELYTAINTIFFDRLPSKPKECDEDIVKTVQKLRQDTKDIIKNLVQHPALMPIEQTADKLHNMQPAISALCQLILEYDNHLTKTKKRYKALDFSDLMHYSIKALEDEGIKNSERERYDYIFVDEYQDTNILQETLINSTSKGDNLFCVGDVKQSIYSFRQAEPSLFIDRMDKSSKELEGYNHLISLSENFRSSNAVVDFINHVFSDVMTRNTGGVDYVGDELLKCCANRPNENDKNAKVEMFVINAEEKNKEDNLSNIEYEAIKTADVIEDIMSKPIYDGKLKTYRPAKYSDICILSRSFKSIVRPVRRILEQRGIPVLPSGEAGYLDRLEIETAINILRIIDNHHHDVALISALLSPAFGFSIEQLIAIRKTYSNPKDNFYKAVESYAENESNELSNRISAFFDKITRYKTLSLHMPIGEFVWYVLSDTMLYDAVGALPGGRVRQQNLRLLAQRADGYSNTPGRNLSSFISHVISVGQSDVDLEPAQNNSSVDAVKFMSIHKSKGLEFPVVILINTASQGRRDTSDVSMAGGMVPGIKSYDPDSMTTSQTISLIAGKSKKDFIENAERLRVLYVALTRARERLCIIGTIGSNFDKHIQSWSLPKKGELLFGKSFLDILGSAIIRVKDNAIQNDIEQIDIDNIHASIINAEDLKHNKQKRKGAVLSAIMKAQKLPCDDNPFEFDYKIEDYVPAKTSVTALLDGTVKQHEIAEFLETPKFLQQTMEFDAAARGTITHTVMQFIDFRNQTDIKSTIALLVDKNILTNEEANLVDIDAINRFLSSVIAQRIKNSDHVKKELPFVLSVDAKDVYDDISSNNKVLVQGIIDLCFLEDDKWVVVDYKTNKITINSTPEILLEHYKNQLKLYSRALEELSWKSVKEAGIYLLSEAKENAFYII